MFKFLRHWHWADFDELNTISDATAIHSYMGKLVFGLRQITSIGIVAERGVSGIIAIAAFVVLFALCRLSMFGEVGTLAIGTVDGCRNHCTKSKLIVLQSRLFPQIYNPTLTFLTDIFKNISY